jgi:hypothetical protein
LKTICDVSFLASLVIDTCLDHLPLYRQHQRLLAIGITVSRQWLIQQVLAVALLLAPLVAAIRAIRVKAMVVTFTALVSQTHSRLAQSWADNCSRVWVSASPRRVRLRSTQVRSAITVSATMSNPTMT